MTKHIRGLNTQLSRRQVMIGAAGLTFAIALGADSRARAGVLGAGTLLVGGVAKAVAGTPTAALGTRTAARTPSSPH